MLGGKLNINTASEQDFRYALGVSAEIARRIVAYCAAHGPCTAISQLPLVPIARTTYDRIRLLVTVGTMGLRSFASATESALL
jgi:DNA uptake protein ComE-like DNA-binding protein